MAELLLEILSEEIPARMQARAADDLHRLVADGLARNGIAFEAARSYVTPRRLVLVIEGLPLAGPDVAEERRGPRVGSPAQALDGFLKSTGMAVEQLEQRDTGKGVFFFAVINKQGRPTPEVLTEVIAETMAGFPWPKSMRWGANSVRWVRPVQSIACLLDGAVVPVSFGPITAGNLTRGHRFLAPESFRVTGFADYLAKLRRARVMLDPVERRHAILAGAEALAGAEGLTLKPDDGLLAEVTGLVEWPVPLIGSIDDGFMAVPAEVLITSMRSHQKYFSLLKPDGSLAPRFIVVSNMEASDGGPAAEGSDCSIAAKGGGAVVAGNQRVLRARLSDAKFFWDTDRRHSLQSRLPRLEERLFYARLGTLADKVVRIQNLVSALPFLSLEQKGAALAAATLCKADLSAEMVGEFPELQGIMGRYYALNDGLPAEVADAIAEHYAPLGPGDACPTAPISVAVSLADKIDSLVGFFAINEKPTGSKDPFALRRAALGVIRLVVENRLRLPLRDLFAAGRKSYGALERDAAGVGADLLDFFADRLKVALKEKGVRHDLIDAVFSLGREDDLVRLLARVEALGAFLDSDDGANLLVAYRRAANIVRIEEKKDGQPQTGAPDPALLALPEEQALAAALDSVGPAVDSAVKTEDFAAAMAALATLRRPLDAFFDKVTVNADQPELRANRLRLLTLIGAAMGRLADFSKVEG